MKIQDFVDMEEFERIMANWASTTGLATVAVGIDGKYISDCYNFTDFCMKYTRGTQEGRARCEACDRKGHGVYRCHAGLIDFGIDLVVGGEKVGTVIGGQVLPSEPDDERFRKTAEEIGVHKEKYIKALHKVNVRDEAMIHSAAELLDLVMNNYINSEYAKKQNVSILSSLADGIRDTNELVEKVRKETSMLKSIQDKQKMLALNASIEAARAGDKGAGFAVVAGEVGKLSERSTIVNKNIEEIVKDIYDVVCSLQVRGPAGR